MEAQSRAGEANYGVGNTLMEVKSGEIIENEGTNC